MLTLARVVANRWLLSHENILEMGCQRRHLNSSPKKKIIELIARSFADILLKFNRNGKQYC